MELNRYVVSVEEHYRDVWRGVPVVLYWENGPIQQLPPEFRILKFPPSPQRDMWTYATCGMSGPLKQNPIEIHVFTREEHDGVEQLLAVIAHYHHNTAQLTVGDTVNFGEPWWDGSKCDHGLVSLPYLDGPSLEWLNKDDVEVQFLWLIPVTEDEVNYKKRNGLDALEERFDTPTFNYVDPFRKSVV